MKNKRKTLFALIVLVIFTIPILANTREIVTVEPDDFPSWTELTNAVPGVRFSVAKFNGEPTSTYRNKVVAIEGRAPSTGSLVFGKWLEATYPTDFWFQSLSDPALADLRADFDLPTNYVSIDIIDIDSADTGQLRAFDAAGNLLETFTADLKGYGSYVTATISRPSADIAYILAAGSPASCCPFNGIALDNFRFNPDSPIDLDIFGMDVGNKWIYRGTRQDQPLTVERRVTVINRSSFAVPVYENKIYENGIFTGTEYYENNGYQLKLWGNSIKNKGVPYDLKFAEGLVIAWKDLKVGGSKYSTSIATVAQYPQYTFNTSLLVNVIDLETLTFNFGTFNTFKVSCKLTVWGNGVNFTDRFNWWILPYIGVVKDIDSESTLTLTTFSIGKGTISEKSDTDKDGLLDIEELLVHGTDWRNVDTDRDGVLDGIELNCGSDPTDVHSICSLLPWLMLLLSH